MKYFLRAWFGLVLFTILYVISTYKCGEPMGFGEVRDRGTCRGEAIIEGFFAGVFPPAYWAFELTHRKGATS